MAAASAALALALAFEGALGDAEVHRAEAATLIDGMPDDTLAIRLDAIAYLTGAEVYMDRFDESAAHGVRGLAVARATGQGFLVPMLTQASATAIGIQGRLDDAAELLDGAIEASRLAGNDQTLAWDLMNRAFVDVHRGEVGAAIADAEESMDLTRGLGNGFVSTHAGVMLAIARWRTANPRTPIELFVAAGGGEAMPLLPGGWRAKYLELLTRCWLMLGKSAEAGRTVEYAAAVAAETGLGMAAAWAQRAAAATALDAGDAAAAAELALSSAAACDLAGAAVEAAVSRTLAGSALGSSRRGASAPWRSSSAPSRLSTKPARPAIASEAERELRKLGPCRTSA